jgi:hypothetical protein
VEVKFAGEGVVLVRDSKDRRDDRPVVGFSSLGWARLMSTITSPG